MGGYLDFSFKQLCDLTRERRRERLVAVSMRAEPDLAQIERACIRVHGEGYEFKARIAELMGSGRRKSAASVWRRAQWKIGNRRCHYCRCPLEKPPKAGATPTPDQPPQTIGNRWRVMVQTTPRIGPCAAGIATSGKVRSLRRNSQRCARASAYD